MLKIESLILNINTLTKECAMISTCKYFNCPICMSSKREKNYATSESEASNERASSIPSSILPLGNDENPVIQINPAPREKEDIERNMICQKIQRGPATRLT